MRIAYLLIFFSLFVQAQHQNQSRNEMMQNYLQQAEALKEYDFKQSLKYLTAAEKLALTQSDDEKLGEIQNLKGQLFYQYDDPDSSLIYYHKSLQKVRADAASEKRIRLWNNIGLAFQKKDLQDSALVYFNKSLALCRTQECGEILCSLYNNIGMTVYYLGNPKQSLTYFEQAYQCFIANKKTEHLAELMNNITSLKSILGDDVDEATFLNLLDAKDAKITPQIKATIYLNLGNLYLHQKQWDNAKKYYHISKTHYDSISNPYYPEVLHGLGTISFHQNNYASALDFYTKLLSDFPNYQKTDVVLYMQAMSLLQMGKTAEAVPVFELWAVRKDALANLKIDTALSKAQEHIEVISKSHEIAALTLETAVQEAKKKRAYILVGCLLLMVFLGMGWFLNWSKKTKIKSKLQALALEQKNQKILDFKSALQQRESAIKAIEEQFEQYKNNKDIHNDLKQHIIEILPMQGDWELFTNYFDDQHQGFYDTLLQYCPELTNNDLRMCSLTKMRLSVKETAGILNLSVDAVKSSRYRIKKKLGLAQEVSLSDYLNSL